MVLCEFDHAVIGGHTLVKLAYLLAQTKGKLRLPTTGTMYGLWLLGYHGALKLPSLIISTFWSNQAQTQRLRLATCSDSLLRLTFSVEVPVDSKSPTFDSTDDIILYRVLTVIRESIVVREDRHSLRAYLPQAFELSSTSRDWFPPSTQPKNNIGISFISLSREDSFATFSSQLHATRWQARVTNAIMNCIQSINAVIDTIFVVFLALGLVKGLFVYLYKFQSATISSTPESRRAKLDPQNEGRTESAWFGWVLKAIDWPLSCWTSILTSLGKKTRESVDVVLSVVDFPNPACRDFHWSYYNKPHYPIYAAVARWPSTSTRDGQACVHAAVTLTVNMPTDDFVPAVPMQAVHLREPHPQTEARTEEARRFLAPPSFPLAPWNSEDVARTSRPSR
jgi:hypothetical protein